MATRKQIMDYIAKNQIDVSEMDIAGFAEIVASAGTTTGNRVPIPTKIQHPKNDSWPKDEKVHLQEMVWKAESQLQNAKEALLNFYFDQAEEWLKSQGK